jgi:hypothetical protein
MLLPMLMLWVLVLQLLQMRKLLELMNWPQAC